MSTLNIHDLQGISAYSNVIRVPNGHSLNTVGNFTADGRVEMNGSLKLPTWVDAGRPSSPVAGDMGYNFAADKNYVEIYNGTEWVSVGATAATGVYNDATVYAPLEDNKIYVNGTLSGSATVNTVNYGSFGTDEANSTLTVLKNNGSGSQTKVFGSGNPGTSHTISLWFRSASTGDNGMLFSKANDSGDTQYNVDIWDGNGNNNIYNNNGDGYNNPFGGTSGYRFNHSDWKHYCFVNDGSTAKLYRDGSLIGNSSFYRSFVNHQGSWSLGSWSGQYFGSYALSNARFRKFAVWNNTAKNAGEVSALFNAGI